MTSQVRHQFVAHQETNAPRFVVPQPERFGCKRSSPSPRPNAFPTPPRFRCPSRDERFAIRGPPGEGESSAVFFASHRLVSQLGVAASAALLRQKAVAGHLEKLALTPALSPRRGRIFGGLQAYSPFGEFVNLRALATVAGRLTCDID